MQQLFITVLAIFFISCNFVTFALPYDICK